MNNQTNLEQVAVCLPPSIIRIIEDEARRNGERRGSVLRSKIVKYMLASDEVFICKECKQYVEINGMGSRQDVCAVCEREDT